MTIRITITVPERVAARLAQMDPAGRFGVCMFCPYPAPPTGHSEECIWRMAYEWWFAPAKVDGDA